MPETVIHTVIMQVERKQIEMSLRENHHGRFLRISESVGSHRDAVIVPAPGLIQLRDALTEMIDRDQASAIPPCSF